VYQKLIVTWNVWGKVKVEYVVLVRKPEGKSLGTGLEDNFILYFEETEWKGMEWFDMIQERNKWRILVNAVMYFGGP
jgi:hypothetical protein